MQADGKILVAGWANDASLASRPVVLRRAASGVSEDTGFGNTSGRGLFVATSDSAIYDDLTIDTSGRIALVGSDGTSRSGAVRRLTRAGVPDTTFNGTSGPTLYSARTSNPTTPAYSTAFKRVFLDGGRPVLAGESPDSSSANTDYDLVITRLQSDLIFADSFE